MIRLLSYIYPISRKLKSRYNGELKIVYFNGKKLLDSKNANYSYGSLQKILKTGLSHFNLSKANNCLLLGLGGGSIIQTLQSDFNYKNKITAIEFDPEIIVIAKEEFGIKNTNLVSIICADAYDFCINKREKYALVIIDLFIDNEVPNLFYEPIFWQNLSDANQILFNASLQQPNDNRLKKVIQLLENNNFKVTILHKVNKTNTLLIAKK